MNQSVRKQLLAAITGMSFACLSASEDAVELYLDEDLQQIRVEAFDPDAERWVAVASGYRDHADPGWLKIGLPGGYEESRLRLMGSSSPSPFFGRIESPVRAGGGRVNQLPEDPRGWAFEDGSGGGETVIEEADIWAWEDNLLYFYNQYRGLQVLDLSDPADPLWVDYYRYPAKGEDLYAFGDGQIVLIGSGSWWNDTRATLQFLRLSGDTLTLEDSVSLEAGQYLDSRRYGDFLYVMTREWAEELNPMGERSRRPLIRLYTIALDEREERVLDVRKFEGNGWLDAVLAAQPDGILISVNRWQGGGGSWRWRSEVHVLVPGEDGVPDLLGVAPLAGVLRDQYKMRYADGLLTTVSQQSGWNGGDLTRVTRMENFELGPDGLTRVGFLDLAPGETLFATRFYEDFLYVVTFLLVDPLFAIDNSDPARPRIVGELEVPGWSDHLEWIDNRLFAIGPEEGRLSASIFDVSDPSRMFLLDRVYLSKDSWSGSEAQYDDQAIAFYPGRNLFMLPFTTWSWERDEQVKAMQLITWTDEGLELRGRIQHLDTPRRGSLLGDTVVTISGREVVTTDISDPDFPEELGSAVLAWNASRLIVLGDHLVQLEIRDLSSGYWYWEIPYREDVQEAPRLYVTTREEPNVPAAEVILEPGKVVGSAVLGGRLLLLQDLSGEPSSWYGELPEKQTLALRLYSLADPLSPVLLDEAVAGNIPYLASRFEAHAFGNSVVWASDAVADFGIYYLDIWPGPWFMPSDPAYLVSTVGTLIDTVTIDGYERFSPSGDWGNASPWHRADSFLLASLTDYIHDGTHEDEAYRYRMESRLLAMDFTDPQQPLQLPEVELPTHIAAVRPLGDGLNHYLYFEPASDVLEVWGWDTASVFRLFRQEIDVNDADASPSWSFAWMPPFHLRQRSENAEGISTAWLEAYGHVGELNRFDALDRFSFEGEWFRAKAVLDPHLLVVDNDQLHLFAGKEDSRGLGFALKESIALPFPDIHSLKLAETVFLEDEALIPAGLYGVEELPLPDSYGSREVPTAYRVLEDTGTLAVWHELDTSRWERVSREAPTATGVIKDFTWLFRPDSIREVDPFAGDAGDLWRVSEWFGWYVHRTANPSWIQHLEHGPLFTYVGDDVESSGFHAYDADIGHFWTHATIYPWLYRYATHEWTWYLRDSGLTGNRWFYSTGTGWYSVD